MVIRHIAVVAADFGDVVNAAIDLVAQIATDILSSPKAGAAKWSAELAACGAMINAAVATVKGYGIKAIIAIALVSYIALYTIGAISAGSSSIVDDGRSAFSADSTE